VFIDDVNEGLFEFWLGASAYTNVSSRKSQSMSASKMSEK
jgi:hypothetical protein